MGDVEVVGLRTSDRSIIVLTPCEKLEIPADANDLGCTVEERVEALDGLRRKSHRQLLETDIRPVGVADQPFLTAENPDLQSVRIEHVDRAPSDRGRQQMPGDHRKVGCRYNPAVEAADRRRDCEGPE
jgi:hypothetical protein